MNGNCLKLFVKGKGLNKRSMRNKCTNVFYFEFQSMNITEEIKLQEVNYIVLNRKRETLSKILKAQAKFLF